MCAPVRRMRGRMYVPSTYNQGTLCAVCVFIYIVYIKAAVDLLKIAKHIWKHTQHCVTLFKLYYCVSHKNLGILSSASSYLYQHFIHSPHNSSATLKQTQSMATVEVSIITTRRAHELSQTDNWRLSCVDTLDLFPRSEPLDTNTKRTVRWTYSLKEKTADDDVTWPSVRFPRFPNAIILIFTQPHCTLYLNITNYAVINRMTQYL